MSNRCATRSAFYARPGETVTGDGDAGTGAVVVLSTVSAPYGTSAETFTAAPTGASEATNPTLSSRAGSPRRCGAIQRMSRWPSAFASSVLRAVTSMRTVRSLGCWFISLATCITIGGASSAPQGAPPGRASSLPAKTIVGPCEVS